MAFADGSQVHALLEPLGFAVHDIDIANGLGTRWDSYRELQATSYQGPMGSIDPVVRPARLLVDVPGPGALSSSEVIRIGVSAPSAERFSGRAMVLRDFAHLQSAAPNIVPFFEQHAASFLCPKCRGLRRFVHPRRGGESFIGCQNYNAFPPCDWTSSVEADAPWHLSP